MNCVWSVLMMSSRCVGQTWSLHMLMDAERRTVGTLSHRNNCVLMSSGHFSQFFPSLKKEISRNVYRAELAGHDQPNKDMEVFMPPPFKNTRDEFIKGCCCGFLRKPRGTKLKIVRCQTVKVQQWPDLIMFKDRSSKTFNLQFNIQQ